MADTKAREEMSDSLRRFGMSEEAITKIWENEDQIAEGKRAKRRAAAEPVKQEGLDFGDWM